MLQAAERWVGLVKGKQEQTLSKDLRHLQDFLRKCKETLQRRNIQEATQIPIRRNLCVRRKVAKKYINLKDPTPKRNLKGRQRIPPRKEKLGLEKETTNSTKVRQLKPVLPTTTTTTPTFLIPGGFASGKKTLCHL